MSNISHFYIFHLLMLRSLYSETSGIGASGIGEPLESGRLECAKTFFHTNEPLESGK